MIEIPLNRASGSYGFYDEYVFAKFMVSGGKDYEKYGGAAPGKCIVPQEVTLLANWYIRKSDQWVAL